MRSTLVSTGPVRTQWPVEFAPLVRIVRGSWRAARKRCTKLGPMVVAFSQCWFGHFCLAAIIWATNSMGSLLRRRTHSPRRRACIDRATVCVNPAPHARGCKFFVFANRRRHRWPHGRGPVARANRGLYTIALSWLICLDNLLTFVSRRSRFYCPPANPEQNSKTISHAHVERFILLT